MSRIKKIHQIHGAVLTEEESILDNFSSSKISTANKKELENMSLKDLQSYAEDLHLIPEDDRNSLIIAIKKALKNQ